MRKLTTSEFIKRAKKVHGNKYDYSKVEYNGTHTEVEIVCNLHGPFFKTPHTFLAGYGCYFCSYSMLVQDYPHLTEEWDYEKNVDIDINSVFSNSHQKVWWKCKKVGHSFDSVVSNRTRKGYQCPYCSNQRLCKDNCLATLYPELSKEWHPTKNGNLTPKDVIAGSPRKVWWKCKKGHKYDCRISHRTEKGVGCPYCSNQKVCKDNCLATTHPELLKEWDYTKNGDLDPNTIVAGFHKKVNWICVRGHKWQATPINRSRLKHKCPYCSNQKVCKDNCLATTHPELLKDWDYTKNGDLTPEDVVAGSSIIVWWKCKKGHSWETSPSSRARTGCPVCGGGWGISCIRIFLKEVIELIPFMSQTEWYHILRSSGILDISLLAKSSNFVNLLPQKDKLDFDELQKFVNNEPSIYEDMIETGDTSLVEEENNIEDFINEEENKDLINLNVKDIFRTLEKISNLPYIDDEIAEALIGEKIWQLIQIVCEDESKIKDIQKQKSKFNLPKEVKTRFLNLSNEACKYKLPKDYNFKIDGKLVKPNLMQRLTIALLKDKKYLLNLSGTGAGKTLSALLFSRYINSNLTIIVCPNDVIDGWERTLKGVDPKANVFINNFSPKINRTKSNYVVFNVEKFQQSNSENQIRKLLKNTIDFIILDEIQFMKNREGTPQSERNKNIHKLLSNARKNDNLHILGMTATPIINELSEGVSLLELITGQEYNEITNAVTIDNCLALRGHFVSMGIRWMPQYKQKLNIKEVYVDCTDKITEAREIKRNPLLMENLFIEEKMNSILPKLKKGSVIYTQYKDQIVETIRKKVKESGFTCEPYTGDQNHSLRREILDGFINKEIDILIATSPISTGVDGLQHVCNDLYVVSLPWTSAMFQQLIGRFWRQGQKKKQVNVTIPLSYLNVETPDGENKEWSWCKYRYSIVKNKRSLSDVAVDGIIPDKCHISHSKALKAANDWLQRIEGGDVYSFKRRKISVSLSEASMQKRRKKHGDFMAINKKVCGSNSNTIHEEWQKDPSEYETYHNEYKNFRDKWSYDHIDEIVIPFVNSLSDDAIIGDFGSGPLAELSNSVNKEVLSFDHVETDRVVSCDLANMSKEYYNSLDVAVFSLSLMGKNLTDYIREAHKCLKKDGKLFIVELSSRVSSRKEIQDSIEKLGFKNVKIELVDRFIIISAEKSSKVPNKSLKLRLGRIKP